jgi:uncharacterized membrane protein
MEQNDFGMSLSMERIVFFSDAVFAIVITLLVLEIKVPHVENATDEKLNSAILHLLPKFAGFVTSFFIVGLMWFEHHRIFRYIVSFDAGLIWRNLAFLLFISFIPFPTALFSEYPWSKSAFVFYILGFAFAAMAKWWVWTYAVRRGLITDSMEGEQAGTIARRSLAVPLGCLVCLLLGLFLPIYFAVLGFLLIPVLANLLGSAKKPKMGTAE